MALSAWKQHSADPTAAVAVAARQAELESAWTRESRDRLSVITDACRGRKVLDVGCVNHEAGAVDDPGWLHARIASVADECVGLDVESDGVDRMQRAGYNAVCADVAHGTTALASLAPFDVVVAGEVIEHLRCPQDLLDLAAEVLRPGGSLVVTTPNPYAPGRVRAGRLRLVWENVDHVAYLFPSGMAELAGRSGLVLRTATTVGIDPPWAALKASLRTWAAARLGHRPLPANYLSPLDAVTLGALSRRARSGSQLGETSVYILVKPGNG